MIFDEAKVSFCSQQLLHRSNRLTFAGDDQIEITEIGVYVECETMCSNPARNMHTNGCHFTAVRVYTGQAFDPERIDTEVGHGPNQDFFQIANITMNVFAVGTEIDDWITDHLPFQRRIECNARFYQRLAVQSKA